MTKLSAQKDKPVMQLLVKNELVGAVGLEPTSPKAADFKSAAYANSATLPWFFVTNAYYHSKNNNLQALGDEVLRKTLSLLQKDNAWTTFADLSQREASLVIYQIRLQ